MKFTYAFGARPIQGYTIRRGLGRGGFGEVYLGVSDGGKEVALKLVQQHLDVELRGVGQCLNLKHPNLVVVHDILKAADDDTWIVMEYVAGESLEQMLARHPQGIPEPQALAWLHGICSGVRYLHEHGIVHRDLKPGNLFIENGVVKIGDYGLSKFISASRRSGQTVSIGSVHYMAREISQGRYGHEVDQYALGIILCQMLTGRVPFDGESQGEILMKHLTADPDLGRLTEPYRSVVARLLDKDPGKRYPAVRDLLDELPALDPGMLGAFPRSEQANPSSDADGGGTRPNSWRRSSVGREQPGSRDSPSGR
jgi:serine/threonine protein kinase